MATGRFLQERSGRLLQVIPRNTSNLIKDVCYFWEGGSRLLKIIPCWDVCLVCD